MSTGETLLGEILQHPEDDAPRLVYADWLQQHGDAEHGELIGAQCAFEHARGAQRTSLAARIRELVKRNRARWTAPLRRAKLGTSWKFRRGFLDSGTVSATRFVKIAAELFALAPTLRSFRFPEASNELVDLVESPYFARVVEADLHTMCSCGSCRIDQELPELFTSPHATSLRVLRLADCRITDDNAKRLAASEVLTQLTLLDLATNRITGTGAQAIANASFTGLRELSLRGNPLAEGAVAFARSRRPWLDTIERLDFRDCDLPPATREKLRARFGRRARCE